VSMGLPPTKHEPGNPPSAFGRSEISHPSNKYAGSPKINRTTPNEERLVEYLLKFKSIKYRKGWE